MPPRLAEQALRMLLGLLSLAAPSLVQPLVQPLVRPLVLPW